MLEEELPRGLLGGREVEREDTELAGGSRVATSVF